MRVLSDYHVQKLLLSDRLTKKKTTYSRKTMSSTRTKKKEGENRQQQQIMQQREFIQKLWDDPLLRGDIQTEIYHLIRKCFEFVDILTDGDQKEFVQRFHHSRFPNDGAGVVERDIETINAVLDPNGDGNIRERMTMIFSFAQSSCDLLWDAIIAFQKKDAMWSKIKHLLHARDMKRRIALIERTTGLRVSDIIVLCERTNCKEKGTLIYDRGNFPSMCHVNRYSKLGPVSAARALKPDFRTETEDDVKSGRFVRRSDILPPLSMREQNWLAEHDLLDKEPGDGLVRWTTGYVFWNMQHDGAEIYTSLFEEYDRLSIAGPSGNTDLHLDVAMTFADTDPFNNFVGCVVWMGNGPDHSIAEMLLAASPEPFGSTTFSETYQVTQDPHEFLLQEIQSHRNIFAAELFLGICGGLCLMLACCLIIWKLWENNKADVDVEEEDKDDTKDPPSVVDMV